MPTSKPLVFVDANEMAEDRNEPFKSAMYSYFGRERIQIDNLPVDMSFVTPDGVTKYVERKVVPNDLLASIKDGRLSKQGAILAENGGFLILEGRIRYDQEGSVLQGGKSRGWTVFHVMGAIASLQDAGVKVLWSGGPDETPFVIHEAYKYSCNKGGGSIVGRRPGGDWAWPGAPTQAEKTLYAFQGFVGQKIAMVLWEHFGTLRNFLDASEAELKSIPGIGPTTARKIIEILDKEWK